MFGTACLSECVFLFKIQSVPGSLGPNGPRAKDANEALQLGLVLELFLLYSSSFSLLPQDLKQFISKAAPIKHKQIVSIFFCSTNDYAYLVHFFRFAGRSVSRVFASACIIIIFSNTTSHRFILFLRFTKVSQVPQCLSLTL